MKLSQAVAKVIGLAKAIRHYWEMELPKRHPDYPIMNAGEEPLPPPSEEKKLAKLFASLPDEMVFQIGLLMDLGRGYFNLSEISEYYAALKGNYGSAETLASQMTGKVTLGDYLEDGLAELKNNNIDVDKLPLKRAKAPR